MTPAGEPSGQSRWGTVATGWCDHAHSPPRRCSGRRHGPRRCVLTGAAAPEPSADPMDGTGTVYGQMDTPAAHPFPNEASSRPGRSHSVTWVAVARKGDAMPSSSAPVTDGGEDVALDSRHLQLMLAIGEHQDLARAARSLGLSPSAAAEGLRRGEATLGEVFRHGAERLTVTARGRRVLSHVREILASMSALEADLTRHRTAADMMRVAASILPFEAWLPAMTQRIPGMQWSVVAMPAAEGFTAVAERDADVFCGLRRVDGPAHPVRLPPGLTVHEVLHEPSWVRLPAGHPAASRSKIDLADLGAEVWAVLPDPTLEDGLVSAARRAGFEPDVRFRPTAAVMKEELAIAGQAVSLTSPLAGSRPGMVLRPLTDGPVYAWVLAHRTETLRDHVVTVVADVIREAYTATAQAVPGVPEVVRTNGPILR
jgi:DNA-binding transcriptional LysR family regulator